MISDKEFGKRMRMLKENMSVGLSSFSHLNATKKHYRNKSFLENASLQHYHSKVAREQIVKNRILTKKEKDDIWRKS